MGEGTESDWTLWAKGWSQALHRDRRGTESDSTMVAGKNHKDDLHTVANRAKSDSELLVTGRQGRVRSIAPCQ